MLAGCQVQGPTGLSHHCDPAGLADTHSSGRAMGLRNVARGAEVGHTPASRLRSTDTQLSRKQGGGTSCQRLKAHRAGSGLIAHSSCFLLVAGFVLLGQSFTQALAPSLGIHSCVHSPFPSDSMIRHFTQPCWLPFLHTVTLPLTRTPVCPSAISSLP